MVEAFCTLNLAIYTNTSPSVPYALPPFEEERSDADAEEEEVYPPTMEEEAEAVSASSTLDAGVQAQKQGSI